MKNGPVKRDFAPTPEHYADRIASDRIGLAETRQLNGKLAEYLIELGEDVTQTISLQMKIFGTAGRQIVPKLSWERSVTPATPT
jgi:hypothetical protein